MSLQRPLPQPGSTLAGPLAGLLFNLFDVLFWFSSPPSNCRGDPALHLAPLARNEGALALVKLPASSLAALMGERELGTASGLGSPLLFFFLIQFGIRKLWILANGLVSFIPLIPDLVPCSP